MTNKEFFSVKETSCRCGCGLDAKPLLKEKINKIRELYGKPISLTCAARCPTHNAVVKGAKNSAHISGEAADMVRTEELLKLIQSNLVTLDLYMEDPSVTHTWIHIQTRKTASGIRVFKP